MAARYDLVRDVNVGSQQKIWKLKVRVIRLWIVPNFIDRTKKTLLEMVVIDEQVIVDLLCAKLLYCSHIFLSNQSVILYILIFSYLG